MKSRTRSPRLRFPPNEFGATWNEPTPSDPASLDVIRSCADTIAGAVETVRRLVDEFSTLARFPAAKPRTG